MSGVQWSGDTSGTAEASTSSQQQGGGGAGKRYTKINAALKHFFAYSVESGRGSTNFNISQHDIYDTYLPSFEAPIVKADAKGYMCSYSSVNGVASCGSAFLSGTARNDWNFSGYVRCTSPISSQGCPPAGQLGGPSASLFLLRVLS